ncbi:MAG: tRNA (guanosine(46)-N7)-methyltransferase TrmB [Wigglesworthia glossinidia]|nr:tRNA (guanosine(46)-N7)-methyltransferase TrmB [Wigglesworthia glossinidia]
MQKKNHIRSFVVRQRQLKKNKLLFENNDYKKYIVHYKKEFINFQFLFKRQSSIIIEIGFGSGISLIQSAKNNFKKNFFGIEVYLSGIISCLKSIKIKKVTNLKIIYYDAVEVLKNMIYDNTISQIQLLFPDPWNKSRHHKRRIFQKEFIKILYRKLIQKGVVLVITDSESYLDYILYLINSTKYFKISSDFSSLFCKHEFPTKFETLCINKKRIFFTLIFKKI